MNIRCLHPLQAVSAGLGLLQFCNINSFRTKFILGFSFFMGLSIPQYFREYYVVSGYGPVHTRSITVRGSSQPLPTVRHGYNAPQEQHALLSQKKFLPYYTSLTMIWNLTLDLLWQPPFANHIIRWLTF